MNDEEKSKALAKVINRLTISTIFILVIIATSVYFFNDIEKMQDRFSYLTALVFTTGLVGGFVSLQQRLHKIEDEELMLLSKSILSIAVIPINGGIFAYILMLMFMGKIIQGELFPTFPDIDIFDLQTFKIWLMYSFPMSGAGMAKLLFWSFVAGFSERFVPRMINATVGSVRSKNSKKNEDLNSLKSDIKMENKKGEKDNG